MKESLK